MEPTKEQKERIDGFMGEYQALVEKWKVDMFSFPVWVPSGNGEFKTVMQAQPVLKDEHGTPSPEEFIPKA